MLCAGDSEQNALKHDWSDPGQLVPNTTGEDHVRKQPDPPGRQLISTREQARHEARDFASSNTVAVEKYLTAYIVVDRTLVRGHVVDTSLHLLVREYITM